MATHSDFSSLHHPSSSLYPKLANSSSDDSYNQCDKENSNVFQVKPSSRLPLQAKRSSANALAERMDDSLTQSTIDSPFESEQASELYSIPSPFNMNTTSDMSRSCEHEHVMGSLRRYCKNCGVFIPKSGSITHRDQFYSAKLFINPDEEYEIMLKNERKNREYHTDAPHLEFRKSITDWIFQVSQDLKLSLDTSGAIISYVDTILCKVEVSKENLQLVILTCLVLAAKFFEMDHKVPPLKEAYNLCKGAYSLDVFKKSENYILEQLNWDLRTICPGQFVHTYLARGCIFSSDNVGAADLTPEMFKQFRKYSECFANLSLDSYQFNKFSAHIVACSAIASSRKLLGVSPLWSPELEELTGASWTEIESCFKELYSYFEKTYPEFSLENSKMIKVSTEIQSQEEISIESTSDESVKSPEEKKASSKIIRNKKISKVHVSVDVGNKKRTTKQNKTQQQQQLLNIKKVIKKSVSQLAKSNENLSTKINNENKMAIEEPEEFPAKTNVNSRARAHIKQNLIY